ncbi:MAG: right-handed parallel beta-helix repeat-containing protein [Phycisphaerales bacterium]|nr:right-handed parallel beta-helix repeat-containing protein [Phycisphaerales bacterium]
MLSHLVTILIAGLPSAGVPPHFAAWLDYTPTGTTWFIAAEEPGASDANDGLSPSYSGDNHGPWQTLAGPLIHDITLGPGDAVALRSGTYSVNTPDQEISIFSPGTKQNPVMVYAWQDEHVVIDGGFDLAAFIEDWGDAYQDAFNAIYHQSRVFRLDAPFSIVRGLHFTGCPYTCVTWRATHAMMIDCSFESGVEDQIKFTEQPQSNTRSNDNLVYRCDFTRFGNQAIDAWGTRNLWVVDNTFHHNNTIQNNRDDAGLPICIKGGSTDVHFIDNHFHDLTVGVHALLLGGCCWHNWTDRLYDEDGNLLPVAQRIEAIDNLLERITIIDDVDYRGAIGVQGCRDCLVRGNTIIDSTSAIGVHHTRQNVDGVVTTMSPQRTTITQNTSLNTSTGELIMASHPGRGFAAHHNIWFQPGERWFRIKSRIVEGLSAWRSFGLGAGSVALPLNP